MKIKPAKLLMPLLNPRVEYRGEERRNKEQSTFIKIMGR